MAVHAGCAAAATYSSCRVCDLLLSLLQDLVDVLIFNQKKAALLLVSPGILSICDSIAKLSSTWKRSWVLERAIIPTIEPQEWSDYSSGWPMPASTSPSSSQSLFRNRTMCRSGASRRSAHCHPSLSTKVLGSPRLLPLPSSEVGSRHHECTNTHSLSSQEKKKLSEDIKTSRVAQNLEKKLYWTFSKAKRRTSLMMQMSHWMNFTQENVELC